MMLLLLLIAFYKLYYYAFKTIHGPSLKYLLSFTTGVPTHINNVCFIMCALFHYLILT